MMADKRLWIIVLAGAIVLCIVSAQFSSGLKKERSGLISRKKELLALKAEFGTLKSSVDAVEGRKSLTKVEGIVPAIDEIFRSLGLSRKVKSVKPLGGSEQKYAVEEQAELQLEKVDMNEMANILYKIENSPMILSIKKSSMKTSFENPTLLNVTLTVSLIKPK